jgi:hypothetical protein
MHCSNPEEIKTEIEKLGHTVTNIWNIKQYRTRLPLSMFFFVKMKPAPNNKDIINSEYIQKKTNSMVWVRERTIPTERPQLVGEVIANFCG